MTAEDVAAQLARERALRQADKMEPIGRLTGAIAQQFNELLTAILTRTAALAQSLPPNRDLDELKVTAQRGAELVQRLLAFSRHHVLDLQPLILTEFVRDALQSQRRQLPANIEVQFEAHEDGGVVESDPAAVKEHRGALHIVSEGGQGRPAKEYLPAVRDRGMSELESVADEALPGGTEAILLVEDDQAMRLAAQQPLSKVGYRVFTAVDGQQGLDAFRAHRADLQLVITDDVMPKLSGFDMYEVIRGESRGVRVLFMSGFPAPNFRKTVGQDSHVAFVTKPWTASELLAQVRLLLEAPQA